MVEMGGRCFSEARSALLWVPRRRSLLRLRQRHDGRGLKWSTALLYILNHHIEAPMFSGASARNGMLFLSAEEEMLREMKLMHGFKKKYGDGGFEW